MSGIETRSWHADDDLIEQYVRGRLDMGRAASVEAHLMGCERCRSGLAEALPPAVAPRLGQVWTGVRAELRVPPLPFAIRLLRRLGLSDGTAVVLAAARSMSTAWTVATTLVLAFAALAAFAGGDAGRAIYLIVAPLVPVAGVVAAFGPSGDRFAELTATTPFPPARLVLLRAAGVAVTSVPLAIGVGLLLPGTQWLAFAWLAPALAFIVTVLAASTWTDPVVAGGAVALGWSVAVGAAARADDPLLPVAGAAQLAYLAAAAAVALVLAVRIRRSRTPGGKIR